MNNKKDTRYMVTLALMAAVVILLANTPLGMIQLPIIKATTVHIPVIIGSIVLGPAAGAFLGAVFGICSMISNTQAPTLLSFAFSPFLSTTGFVGVIKALWVSIGCRIMIGVVSGWVSIALKNLKVPAPVRLAVTGFVGSMTNTVFVMGSIYLLFAQQYAEVKKPSSVSSWEPSPLPVFRRPSLRRSSSRPSLPASSNPACFVRQPLMPAHTDRHRF